MSDITVVNGPLELWWAPVGESFPAIDATPAGNWAKIGSSGNKNYTDDGVTISPSQTIEDWTPVGSTHARKSFRTEEELIVSVTMADLSMDQVRLALNQNSVTSNASDKEINLERGLDVNTIALLVRGTNKSAEFDGANLQLELFEVREGASQELGFTKGDAAGVLLEFKALENATNGVGVLREGTA